MHFGDEVQGSDAVSLDVSSAHFSVVKVDVEFFYGAEFRKELGISRLPSKFSNGTEELPMIAAGQVVAFSNRFYHLGSGAPQNFRQKLRVGRDNRMIHRTKEKLSLSDMVMGFQSNHAKAMSSSIMRGISGPKHSTS